MIYQMKGKMRWKIQLFQERREINYLGQGYGENKDGGGGQRGNTYDFEW